jgi:hypothetical protein
MMTGEPAGQQVDGEREAVHFDEKRDDESREAAKRAPVAFGSWLEEAEREQDENGRVDDHE